MSETTTTKSINTINDVLKKLDDIIQRSKDNESRIGYFAVLYRMVTQRVAHGIEKGEFNDNPRMEKLDVIFAKRYIDAFHGWNNKEKITHSWQVAFDAAENRSIIVLQQILLGISAHINLDLGLSTMLKMEEKRPFEVIVIDFDEINNVLAGFVDKFKEKLIETPPLVKWACKIGKGKENLLATFSIDIERSGAWYFASKLRHASTQIILGSENPPTLIEEKDKKVGDNGAELASPSQPILNFFVKLASLTERSTPSKVIAKLESHALQILVHDIETTEDNTKNEVSTEEIVKEKAMEEA